MKWHWKRHLRKMLKIRKNSKKKYFFEKKQYHSVSICIDKFILRMTVRRCAENYCKNTLRRNYLMASQFSQQEQLICYWQSRWLPCLQAHTHFSRSIFPYGHSTIQMAPKVWIFTRKTYEYSFTQHSPEIQWRTEV